VINDLIHCKIVFYSRSLRWTGNILWDCRSWTRIQIIYKCVIMSFVHFWASSSSKGCLRVSIGSRSWYLSSIKATILRCINSLIDCHTLCREIITRSRR
jgi:hypothetical protein